MPQHRSPKKSLRADAKRAARNRARRSALRMALREFREIKDVEERKARVGRLVATLDRAAQQGVLHRNASSRLKSRLVRGLSG